jgi:hypothetical protein
MPHRDILPKLWSAVSWAAGSVFSFVTSFMEHSLPVMQWLGCAAAMAAAYFSIRASIATREALRKKMQTMEKTKGNESI